MKIAHFWENGWSSYTTSTEIGNSYVEAIITFQVDYNVSQVSRVKQKSYNSWYTDIFVRYKQ